VSETALEHPVPGWYVDPSGEHYARWWDGSAWADLIRDAHVEHVTANGGGQRQPTHGCRLDGADEPRGPWSRGELRGAPRDRAPLPSGEGPWAVTQIDPTQAVAVTPPGVGQEITTPPVWLEQERSNGSQIPGANVRLDVRPNADELWAGRPREFPAEDSGSQHPLPGWYGDPFGEHGVRWWDGNGWLSRVGDETSTATPSPRWAATPTRPAAPTAVRPDQAPSTPDRYERFAGWILLGAIPIVMAFLAYSSWLLVGAGR